mgnify:CR=1 FL=1
MSQKELLLLASCYKYSCAITGRFLFNGIKNVRKEFPGVSEATIKRIHAIGQADPTSINLAPKRVGRCGTKSKLTEELRHEYIRMPKSMLICG